MFIRIALAGSISVAAAIGWAAPAHAHGIDTDSDRSVLGFVSVGIEHMLLGWDHLMFVAAVLLVASGARQAAKLISLFVIGHSTTLIAATLAGWRVSPEAVDVVITLSVVVAAATALFVRPRDLRWFGALVLGFGLVHGLGLATRFQDLGVPEGGELVRVIAFNVGIEVGQLTAILVLVVLASVVDSLTGEARRQGLLEASAALLLAGGVAASTTVAYAATTSGNDSTAEVAAADYAGTTGTCSVDDRDEPLPGGGGHAAKDFFEPDEVSPLDDFGHAVGDGYVALLYPATLAEPELGELRGFVTGDAGSGMLAGPAEQVGDRFVAVTARLQLTCEELDTAALEAFTSDWFASL